MSDDDSKQLETAVKAQFDRDDSNDVTDRVVDEIKCSIVFQYNWEDLLQSGPVALTCLGSCFIATASNTSRSLTLEHPTGGFQFLKQSSLDANLIDSIDLGRLAFLTAEKNMSFVKDVSKKIYNKVADVMDTLMDPPTAKTQLMPQLTSIKSGADDCYQKAKEVDSDFDKWLQHAMELHAACVQTRSSTDEQIYATQLNMAVAQNRFAAGQDTVKFAKETADKFGKQVDLASEAYKKASDEFPSGWDILGQEIVGALADTVTTALGQVVAAYASNLNPTATAETGVGMFSDLIHGGKNAPPAGAAPQMPPPPPAKQSTAPPYSTDPAYAEIKTDIPYFSLINAVLTKGQDGGVNWDMAAGTDGASAQSMYFALSMLKDAQGRFQQVATSDDPSQALKTALDTAITVATAIQAEVDKSTDAAHKFPEGASDVVKGWQKTFTGAYTSANRLAAVAGNLPGASRAPVMSSNTEDPAVTISKTNAKSAQAQAELDAAKNRMETTQQHLMATQQLYQQASQQLVEQQGKLAEIQADVTRLGQTQLGLEEIKKILIQCIELMVQLKQQIMNLCQFFSAVSGAIEAVTKYTVTPFIDQVSAAVAGDEGKKVGNYTLTDLTRTLIYQAAITVRAYFSVFGDIASMWVTLSTDNIMPGLGMVDDMMLQRGDMDATRDKAAKLQAWSLKAQQAVKDLSGQQRKQILDSMQQRVDDIQTVTKQLPATPAAKQAIQDGAGEVLKTAQEAQKANAAAAPTNHFGMKRVE